jgi:hypothetical protein
MRPTCLPACLLACLPLAAHAEASLTPLFGIWAETAEACEGDQTWVLADGSLIIGGDGGQSCVYIPAEGDGLTLDLLCPIAGETMQASTRRITLGPDGPDLLSVTEAGQTLALKRCPAGE